MLHTIEITFLEFCIGFLRTTPMIQLFTFAPLTVILLIHQYNKQKETIIPGILGLLSAVICFQHFFYTKLRIQDLADAINFINTKGGVRPLPDFIEPIFAFGAGPASSRFVANESIFLMICLYAGSVVFHAIKDHKKSGVVGAKKVSTWFSKKKDSRPNRSLGNELGSGDFANTEQLEKWLRPSGKPCDTMLGFTDLIGDKGILYNEGKFHFPSEERNKHMLVIAKTGSGKTSELILPILYNDCLDPMRTTIVIDSKPEMWKKLAAMTKKYNPEKELILFNPLDLARSLSWNILSKIEDDTDCKLIANTIIMATDNPGSKSDSPFFRNNALAVLNSVMVGLLNDKNDRLSMPRIHELIQSGMKPLCDWIEAHPHALRNSRTFVELARSGSQNADTIMSELGMRLSAWDLTTIRATTYFDEIDLEKLIAKPCLFIVELRESELEMLRPLANVIVIEMLRFFTKRAESFPGSKLPRPISFVIDEFASALGRLPDIHVKLNTLRSRNVSIVAAIQSLGQIKANYGEQGDSVTAGFSTKILIPTLEQSDAEWGSKESGQMTVRFQTQSTGSNKKMIEWFASINDSKQEQVQQRPVLTPDEIGRPAEKISTFFFPNTRVFQGRLRPFYEDAEMRKRITECETTMPEVQLREKPIVLEEKMPTAGPAQAAATPGAPAVGITSTKGWTDDKVLELVEKTKEKLEWTNTTGSARKWWLTFEKENKHRPALILRLAEELSNRKATVTEFFLAYVYSNTDNIQANLHYLDYIRLKKEEEKKRKDEQAKKAVSGAESSEPVVDAVAA